jgi:hypothetical protein
MSVLVRKYEGNRSLGRSEPTFEGLLLENTAYFPHAGCEFEDRVHGGS